MSSDKQNGPVVSISQPIYEILEVMANCYNVDKESIVETALKMFFNCEIKIDRLRREGINRDETSRCRTIGNSPDMEQSEIENVVINLKFS
ncbi:MAG: hypothetical protein LBB24_02610 [Rickettsiales bacterium]|nr:hypothetical protein [Rickettsiales bacterium]